jgi:hypothetical protein
VPIAPPTTSLFRSTTLADTAIGMNAADGDVAACT